MANSTEKVFNITGHYRMLVKTTVRRHFTRTARIKQKLSGDHGVRRNGPSHCWWERKTLPLLWESLAVPQND